MIFKTIYWYRIVSYSYCSWCGQTFRVHQTKIVTLKRLQLGTFMFLETQTCWSICKVINSIRLFIYSCFLKTVTRTKSHEYFYNMSINLTHCTHCCSSDPNSPDSADTDMLLLLGCRSVRSLLVMGNLCRRLRMKYEELWESVRAMAGRGLSDPLFFLMVRKRFSPFLKDEEREFLFH